MPGQIHQRLLLHPRHRLLISAGLPPVPSSQIKPAEHEIAVQYFKEDMNILEIEENLRILVENINKDDFISFSGFLHRWRFDCHFRFLS